jgi:hypothetical protein
MFPKSAPPTNQLHLHSCLSIAMSSTHLFFILNKFHQLYLQNISKVYFLPHHCSSWSKSLSFLISTFVLCLFPHGLALHGSQRTSFRTTVKHITPLCNLSMVGISLTAKARICTMTMGPCKIWPPPNPFSHFISSFPSLPSSLITLTISLLPTHARHAGLSLSLLLHPHERHFFPAVTWLASLTLSKALVRCHLLYEPVCGQDI